MVELRTFQPEDVAFFLETALVDADWPFAVNCEEAFSSFIERQTLAETWNEGLVRSIFAHHEMVGFISLNAVPTEYTGRFSEETVLTEGGTYLLPHARGKGYNVSVKIQMLDVAAKKLHASYCVFVIPNSNVRAHAAMRAVPLPFTIVQAEEHTPFQPWLKRRMWETHQSMTLYAFDLSRSHGSQSLVESKS